MATMADVARQAGVSVSTVSHVVNGTRFVADATRARVLAAVERTGYTRHSAGHSLAVSSTKSIGLAIPAISDVHFADIATALEAGIRKAGYTLLIADTHDDPDEELRVVQTLHQRRVDGMLLGTTSKDPGAPPLAYLEERGVPTVLVDRCASPRFDQVGSENVEASAHAVFHMARLGHTRVGLIAGRPGLTTSQERLLGYRRGLARAGLSFASELVVHGASTADEAEWVTRRLLARSAPPTALCVANNHMTIGVMRALNRSGLRVPLDVALTVYDDFAWASLFEPRLTAIAHPIAQIASRAVDLLVQRIADPDRPPVTVRLEPRFMHRESCGCTG